MELTIRLASDSDIDALHALDAECFAPGQDDLEPAAKGEIEAGVKQQSTFVAISDQRVVGMLQLDKADSNRWELLTVGIASGYRAKGIGSKLMEVIQAELEKSPYLVSVSCVTAPSNLAMQALLERFGFIQMELLSNHFGVGKHRLRFQLN
jgi:ribosomal protein S18 acetylase RimI-like enzyme